MDAGEQTREAAAKKKEEKKNTTKYVIGSKLLVWMAE